MYSRITMSKVRLCGLIFFSAGITMFVAYGYLKNHSTLFVANDYLKNHSTPTRQICASGETLAIDQRPQLVFGILSAHENTHLRETQRNTWISTMLRTHDRLPFQITYKFLIDDPTDDTITENNVYRDILYLNVSHHGRAVKFGEKIYIWLKYINDNYPDALLGAKMDDDAFLCVPQIFYRLNRLKSLKLYYGWTHGTGETVSAAVRIDEMFVVLGGALIKRIANRTYCGEVKCQKENELIDTNYGGTSLGAWLSIYNDVDFQNDNNRITHRSRKVKPIAANLIRSDYCEKMIIYHKSTIEIMNHLHEHNKINSGMDSVPSTVGAVTGAIFSGKTIRNIPSVFQLSSQLSLAVLDNSSNCDNWAVVTTIYPPSPAIKHISNLSNWCLVIVADTQTPPKEKYLKEIIKETGKKHMIKYLAVEEQKLMYPMLSEVIPFKHFGRKNLGYMYAIHHKAKYIWDFDDDNLGIVNLDDFQGVKSIHRKVCLKGFENKLMNPYPYFGNSETRLWPRGFPLQSIKDNTTTPTVCFSETETNIGVIQSLANRQPDVDAIYRLVSNIPFNFNSTKQTHPLLVLPKNTYAPFNAQATVWLSPAFAYMALPISVNGRVSDIWRSYIAQHFFHKLNIGLAFSSPYVVQDRNEHSDIADFNAESDLYLKSYQLIEFLSSSEHTDIEELYESLYMRNYIEESDLEFINIWKKTLMHNTKDG